MDLRESIMKYYAYLQHTLSFVQTESFQRSIRASFLQDELLQDARDPNTYAKALTTDYISSMIASPTFNIKAEEEREEDVCQVHIQYGADCVDILILEALTISGEC